MYLPDSFGKVAASVVLAGAAWWATERVLDSFWRRLPPGPLPLPVIGNLLSLLDEPHRALPALNAKYGPVVTLYFGSMRTVVLGSAEALKEAFVTNGSVTDGRPYTPSTYLSTNGATDIAFSEGKIWRTMRKLAKLELLNPGQLPNILAIVSSEITATERMLHARCARSDGQQQPSTAVIAPKQYIRSISLNTVFRLIVSERLDVEKPESNPALAVLNASYDELFRILGTGALEDVFPLLSKLPTPRMRRMKELVKERDALLANFIAERRKTLDEAPRDVLTSVLRSQTESGVSDAQCMMLINDMLAAGSDTTSSTIEWLILLLAAHPEAQAAVHRELDATFGETTPANDVVLDATKLPILWASVMEAMRIRPVAPLAIPHYTRAAITVGGHHIPANTQLMANNIHIMNDAGVWKEPGEFRPQRFLQEERHMRLLGSGSFPALEDYKFAPFSVGKRYCPGADMAKRQLLLEAVRLMHAFHWAPQPGSRVNLEGEFGLTYEAPAQELLCTARHPTAAVKE